MRLVEKPAAFAFIRCQLRKATLMCRFLIFVLSSGVLCPVGSGNRRGGKAYFRIQSMDGRSCRAEQRPQDSVAILRSRCRGVWLPTR